SWTQIDLENLPDNSPLLKTNSCRELLECVEVQDACPLLSLPQSADQLIDNLPRYMRHNLSYYRRKLATLGDITFDHAVANNFAELFDSLVSLHGVRWRTNTMPGVLFAAEVQNFHRDAGQRFLSHGALRLYTLRLGGRVIACLYGFHHARCTYYYLAGFDPVF